MLFAKLTFLLLTSAPFLASALQCNVCRHGVRLNYTMTSANIPPLPSDCEVVQAEACFTSVFWDFDFKQTFLEFHARERPHFNAPPRDLLSVRLIRGMERDNQTLSSAQELTYECETADKCNGPDNLKKAVTALNVQDQFQQKVSQLLKLITPFDPRSADCSFFHNTTYRCPPPDLRHCRRCVIEADEESASSEHICATCEADQSRDNFVQRWKTFNLTNKTVDFDVATLGCQLKGCNSADNVNLVYASSQINFNFGEFFKH